MKVVLSILNYNGRSHLEYLLPSALDAVREYGPDARVMVLDNRSTDPDVEWINHHFPDIEVVISPQNDFLFSYNWYANQISDEIIILLNNDLRLDPGFIAPLISHFKSPDVFAVSASSWDWEGNEKSSGPSALTFQNGFYNWSFNKKRQVRCHTLFASGGFMAVDRLKFIQVGGFSRLYHPAYMEDVDLCFRAWRNGWRCIYEPSSIVWHRENASWNMNDHSRSTHLCLRNALLFQWSSLPMKRERLKRMLNICKLISGGFVNKNMLWFSELLNASKRWFVQNKKYSSFKVSENELKDIIKRIEKAI
jgi:N-acetylglucosaminyl-diphospho-decaprenol L-rhamnosyltransferase